MPTPDLGPGEQYLRGKVDKLKESRPHEKGETPESREISDLDQAVAILETLRYDAFAQREQAYQKLQHAVEHLKEVRKELAAKVEGQEKGE
jgi:hypothetical protein